MNDMDPEILFAASLGATLSRMRAELDEHAIRRILVFILGRYGVVIDGALLVVSLPPIQLKAGATVREVFPAEDKPQPSTRIPIHSATCPICGKTAVNERGLNTHVYK